MTPSNPAPLRFSRWLHHDNGHRVVQLLGRLGIAARVIGAVLGGLWGMTVFFPTGPTNTVLPPLWPYTTVAAATLAFVGWVIGAVISALARSFERPSTRR